MERLAVVPMKSVALPSGVITAYAGRTGRTRTIVHGFVSGVAPSGARCAGPRRQRAFRFRKVLQRVVRSCAEPATWVVPRPGIERRPTRLTGGFGRTGRIGRTIRTL